MVRTYLLEAALNLARVALKVHEMLESSMTSTKALLLDSIVSCVLLVFLLWWLGYFAIADIFPAIRYVA